MNLDGATVLVTGGTGSFGTAFIRTILDRYDVASVRAFSRDELKQSQMALYDGKVRPLIGDIRDLERLRIATRGVDLIIHAAALKHVPICEYNPFEAIQTNVIGTQNVITAAIENGVSLTVGLSTDKAVAPTNIYGCAKLCAERLLAQAGVYAGNEGPRFAAVRYGNVVGSRGSVIPIFQEQAKTDVITVTDERMTRFWITLDEAVEFVLSSLPLIEDGETFIPKIPSARLLDIAEAVAPDAEKMITGIRPGEKLHETLVTADEGRHAYERDDRYVVLPHRSGTTFGTEESLLWLPDGFSFTSDRNDHWLSVEELRVLIGALQTV